MAVDWNKVDEQYHSDFKDFADDGKYKVKVSGVEIKEVGDKGSIAMNFTFLDDDYAYPKVTHWMSFKEGKDNWRYHHNKELMILLGATEENAKKAVEACEKDSKDATVKAYGEAFSRLAKKNPEVEIEVWQDGKYKAGEFTSSSVRMNRQDDKSQSSPKPSPIEGAEPAVDLSEADLPF